MKELFDSTYLSVMSEEIIRLREENKQLRNISLELEKWLEQQYNDYKALYKMYRNPYFMIEEYEKILKKVQYLKKKYKLGNKENDNNNLKINYAIKPSFTTRKLKELQQENKQLKEQLDVHKILLQTNAPSTCILTELEEWLKGRIEWNKSILEEDKGKSDLLGFNFHREAYIKIWEDTLDKIQKLKEKYK